MEISIDTSKDSPDSIKRVIQLLQSIVGDSALTNSQEAINQQEQYSPMDIFGSADSQSLSNLSSTQQEGQQTKEESAGAGNAGFENLFGTNSEPSQTVQPQPEAKDDEPISDRGLFADLFTQEELSKMESDKPPSSESSDDADSPEADEEEDSSDEPSDRNVIEFY